MSRRGQPILQLSSLLSDLSQLSDPSSNALNVVNQSTTNIGTTGGTAGGAATTLSPTLPYPLTPSMYPPPLSSPSANQSVEASRMAVGLGDDFLSSSSRLMDSVESEKVEHLNERIVVLESTFSLLLDSIGGLATTTTTTTADGTVVDETGLARQGVTSETNGNHLNAGLEQHQELVDDSEFRSML